MTISPLARPFPDLPPVDGCRMGVANAGYKKWTRHDVTLIAFDEGTVAAGVTTQSKCPSPEVVHCRAILPGGKARGLVVNAGNSNAFTGLKGAEACRRQVAEAARLLGCAPDEVFASSTGVIGVPLPAEKAEAGVAAAHAALGTASWLDVTNAIGTTDTFPKAAIREAFVGGPGGGRMVTLVGVIKGSGMIAPDMATMLGYIVTDAAITAPLLQQMLSAANRETFSCITVDSDTSTSDTLLAFATGAAGNPLLDSMESPGAVSFADALADLCRELAHLVVRDGEGASKFIEIRVSGAVSDESARRIGMSIANSPLVKTAIAGGDANWGRVVMAVGKAGEPAERDLLSIRFGGIEVAARGMVVEGYDETPVAAHLAGQDVVIAADLGIGNGRATIWTCDLTHGYISINADYRS